jgi:Domain of unknown function (DUF6265)
MMNNNGTRSVTFTTLTALLGLSLGIAALPAVVRAADDPAIARMAWLTGEWQTQPARGGELDETFEPVHGGEILSTFTSTAKGQITRYELRSIRVQDGKVVFSEAAFGPGMKPLPALPDRVLLRADATHASFEGLEQIRTGKDTMTTVITVRAPDGATRSVKVEFHRVRRFSRG